MAYMEQKLQLVKDFGTSKAMKKMQSQLTNMVEQGSNSVRVKQIKDSRLEEQAQQVQKMQDKLKSDKKGKANQHLHHQFIPEDVLNEIQCDSLLEAIEDQDVQKMNKIVRRVSLTDIFLKPARSRGVEMEEFAQLATYLSFLLQFQNLPNELDTDYTMLSNKLNAPEVVAKHLLDTFSEVTMRSQSQQRKMSRERKESGQYAQIKTKEKNKQLICHGISVMLVLFRKLGYKEVNSQEICSLLKQDAQTLRNFYKELKLDVVKRREVQGDEKSESYDVLLLEVKRKESSD